MTEVATIEPTAIIEQDAPLTPLAMLDRALSTGADVAVLERLFALQERWEASQAQKAFDEAVSAAKANIPVIQPNRKGHTGRYADFAAFARVVDPILSEHGLSYRFRTDQTDKISVTCILSHKTGHSEENTLVGPADDSGKKNSIQAIGSTLTYLQRYTLKQALGLAAAHDDDGQAAGAGPAISEGQLAELRALLDETDSDIIAFCKFCKINALPELPASKFDGAMLRLREKAARLAQ